MHRSTFCLVMQQAAARARRFSHAVHYQQPLPPCRRLLSRLFQAHSWLTWACALPRPPCPGHASQARSLTLPCASLPVRLKPCFGHFPGFILPTSQSSSCPLPRLHFAHFSAGSLDGFTRFYIPGGLLFHSLVCHRCCGVSQNTYHTLKDLRIVFIDGTVLDTSDPASCQAFLKVGYQKLNSSSFGVWIRQPDGADRTARALLIGWLKAS